MSLNSQTEFKKRILDEMTVNYASNLEKNFEVAKQFIRLTQDGTVDILVRDKLPGKDQILLYLIGKMYAKEAGYVTDENVGNNELLGQLGFPIGSLLPFLKELRDEHLVRQVKRENNVYHSVPPALIEGILGTVTSKMNSSKSGLSSYIPQQYATAFRKPKSNLRRKGGGETSVVLQKLQKELVPSGYFKKPRNTAEVRAELESRLQVKFLSRKVSQALGELHDRGVLSRVGSKYEFQYFAQS